MVLTDKYEAIEKWILEQKELAKQAGSEFFMGIPMNWYETTTFCCENLHVFSSYIKSEEKGNVCPCCYATAWLCPVTTTEELKLKLG